LGVSSRDASLSLFVSAKDRPVLPATLCFFFLLGRRGLPLSGRTSPFFPSPGRASFPQRAIVFRKSFPFFLLTTHTAWSLDYGPAPFSKKGALSEACFFYSLVSLSRGFLPPFSPLTPGLTFWQAPCFSPSSAAILRDRLFSGFFGGGWGVFSVSKALCLGFELVIHQGTWQSPFFRAGRVSFFLVVAGCKDSLRGVPLEPRGI